LSKRVRFLHYTCIWVNELDLPNYCTFNIDFYDLLGSRKNTRTLKTIVVGDVHLLRRLNNASSISKFKWIGQFFKSLPSSINMFILFVLDCLVGVCKTNNKFHQNTFQAVCRWSWTGWTCCWFDMQFGVLSV
jgi:hypothetical protein